MDQMVGTLGTWFSLSLRFGQAFFSLCSLLFMSVDVEFYSFSVFCYLMSIMGLVVSWSVTLAIVDIYTILAKCQIRRPGILVIVVLGDWVLTMLSLAAASSTAGVVDLFVMKLEPIFCPRNFCDRYQLSSAMTFLSFLLTGISFLLNFRLLPNL